MAIIIVMIWKSAKKELDFVLKYKPRFYIFIFGTVIACIVL
jgi:hypothetical protein